MELMNYQITAVKELLGYCWKLLGIGASSIVFQSPTGSGKTVMTAELLKKLAGKEEHSSEKDHVFSFVWIAPQKLHQQSKDKLQKHYTDTYVLECKNYNDLSGNKIGENEILFLNWESINSGEINIIMQENEKGSNLDKVIDNTIKNKHEIILIVDESHNSANTPKAKKLIEMLRPSVIIYMSATPSDHQASKMTTVPIEDVKEEGMIKKSIIINAGFNSNIVDIDGKIKTDLPIENLKKRVLKEALKKREELAKAFLQEGYNINPLLLIQLPDKTKGNKAEPVKDDIIDILTGNDITEDNGRLAVYLSEDKKNLEKIENNESKTEILLFKQAIVLGWDCPRAHVLVLFREWHSHTFSIQTLGRIMRMPLPEIGGYFKNEILNLAYVYTSHKDIEIDKNIDENYIKAYASERIENYDNVCLSSVYRKQQRDKTRLDPSFIGIFQEEANEHDLKNQIKTEGQVVSRQIIAGQSFEDVDKIDSIESNLAIIQHSPKDLQNYFDDFVKENLQCLALEDRSIGRVKEAIYKFLQKEFDLYDVDPSRLVTESFEYFDDINFTKIISIIMSDHNNSFFATVIINAVVKYSNIKDKKEEELVEKDDWEVPETLGYSNNHTKEQRQKSVMQPFYKFKNLSNVEKKFIDYLEKSLNVKWWFKNGDHGSTYFSVPYEENGKKRLFYVDFVVLLNNGKIGIYDTKMGITLEVPNAAEKRKGLNTYTDNHKNVVGGIVTNHNGSWRIMPQDASQAKSEWDILTEI